MAILSIVFLVLAAITFLVQVYYLWGLFGKFAFHRRPRGVSGQHYPVSVVISAHNEYMNLKKNLPKILEQDYPEFEVVVVNDFSDDESAELLEDYSRQYQHLRVVTLSQRLNFFKGKKFPLSIGIKAANYEHLLLTDADCVPASNRWINEMMKGFDNQAELVIGYGAYLKQPGFLNTIIRFETLKTALQYFSMAAAGKPYMGVGRNIAYLKSVFYRSGGFVSHYNISSGDDDLFVNKIATKSNTRIVYSSDSHTLSQAKLTFKTWFKQKKRHLSTGRYYKKNHKLTLGGYALSRLLFYISLIILLITLPLGIKYYAVGGTGVLFLLSQVIIFQQAATRLNENKLGYYAPIMELLFVLWEPVLFIANALSKNNQWK